jgi:hypothetical protein
MTSADFIGALTARGGAADIWLVYQADAYSLLVGDDTTLTLQHAFWTRGEAYACAHAAHRERQWQHYYVFRVLADTTWASSGDPRVAIFETAFERVRPLPAIEVRADTLVSVFE